MMPLRPCLIAVFLLATSGLAASNVVIQSSQVQYVAVSPDVGTGGTPTPGYWGFELTAAQSWNMLYSLFGSSHAVFNVGGVPFDMQQSATVSESVTELGSGLGAYVESAKDFGNVVCTQRATIVLNPRSGLKPTRWNLPCVCKTTVQWLRTSGHASSLTTS